MKGNIHRKIILTMSDLKNNSKIVLGYQDTHKKAMLLFSKMLLALKFTKPSIEDPPHDLLTRMWEF